MKSSDNNTAAGPILLIQPPIQDFYLTRQRTTPHALACLAAALMRDGFAVELLDALAHRRSPVIPWPEEMGYLEPYFGRSDRSPFALFHRYYHFGLSMDQIGERVRALRPWLVGISSSFTPYAEMALRVAEVAKARHPGGIVVLGGHHPTILPESVMACPAVDYVLRGEGELGLPLLAQALQRGSGIEQVPGIVFRRPTGELQLSEPAFAARLDDYPLPCALGAPENRQRAGRERGRKVVLTSRGCPFRCSYCAVGADSSLPYRRRSVDVVLEEMERAVLEQGCWFIDFEDENLALERDWLLALLRAWSTRHNQRQVELRAMNGLLPHTLDEALIVSMKQAGFKVLNLSLGSSCSEQLKRFRRPDERAPFLRAVDLAERHGLQVVGYIIVGAPGQGPCCSVDDLLLLAELRVLAGVSIFYPAPGSADFQRCAAAGLLPSRHSLFRATALPLSAQTTREQAITLWRLGRLLNFAKSLLDRGEDLPRATACPTAMVDPRTDRDALGRQLLGAFLQDGIIRGWSVEGTIYAHHGDVELGQRFVQGLESRKLRGSQ